MAGVLQGKVAIVTGSSRGIGRAIAEAYAREGAQVVVHGTNEKLAAETVARIREAGGVGESQLGDVADPAFAPRVVAFAVEKFGGLDILVSNAGMSGLEPLLTMPHETWRRFLDVHVSGSFYIGQEAARRMVAQGRGGRILNTSSVASTFAVYGLAAYGTAKAALLALTRGQAVEWAEHKITANALVPGPVRTDMMDEVWGPVRMAERCNTIPMGRMAEAEEVAALAVFLASPAAGYITGQSYVIDGGASAAGLYAHEVHKHWTALRSEEAR
jgi:NAD(P)-dependent dehydrogenase (short-subunit alcohol dehydrogenase family)